tara:strand:+ start:673 stop:2247 length:1575 start_codon:yes stop_codon:yes gene_type:complete
MATPDSIPTDQSIFYVNNDKVPSLKTGEYEFFKKDLSNNSNHLHLLKMPIFNSMLHLENSTTEFENNSNHPTSRAKILFKDTHSNKHPNFQTSKFHQELFLGMYKKKVTDIDLIKLANKNFDYNNPNIKKTRLIVDVSKNLIFFSDGIDLHINLKLVYNTPNNESFWEAENKKKDILNHMGEKVKYPSLYLLIKKLKNGNFKMYILWYTPLHDLLDSNKTNITWDENSIRITGTNGNIEPSYFKGFNDLTDDPYKTALKGIDYTKYTIESLIPNTSTGIILPPIGLHHHPNKNWPVECEYRALQNTIVDHTQICSFIDLTNILFIMPTPLPSRYDKKQDQNILDIKKDLGLKDFSLDVVDDRLKKVEDDNKLDKITASELNNVKKNISSIEVTLKDITTNKVDIKELFNRLAEIEKVTILKDIKPPKPEDTIEYKLNKINQKLSLILSDISKNKLDISQNYRFTQQYEPQIINLVNGFYDPTTGIFPSIEQLKKDIDFLIQTKQDKVNSRSLEDKLDILLDKLN